MPTRRFWSSSPMVVRVQAESFPTTMPDPPPSAATGAACAVAAAMVTVAAAVVAAAIAPTANFLITCVVSPHRRPPQRDGSPADSTGWQGPAPDSRHGSHAVSPPTARHRMRGGPGGTVNYPAVRPEPRFDRRPHTGAYKQGVPAVSNSGRPVVLIADKLAQSTVEALGDSVEVRWVDGPNRDELLAAVPEADAILVRSATTVDAEVLAAAPQLKIVGRAGVGLDNVDIPAATERGVMVVNAPTSNIHSAAEHAVALLMATARQVAAADKTLREHTWKRSAFNGVEIL